MGSKLSVNESPHHSRSAVAVPGEGGSVSLSNGNNLRIDGSSGRRHHSHSRRTVSNAGAGGPVVLHGNLQRQRAASTSEALTVNGEPHGGPSASTNQRAAGSQRQYSLFGHYWDAFLNSDSSSDEERNRDEYTDGDDSSSGSEHQQERNANERSRHRHHHHSRHGAFYLSQLTAPGSAANNAAFQISAANASSPGSSALSRASDRRRLRALIAAHSLPFPLFSMSDFKCPVCHKSVPSEDVELHVVVCLTKPRIEYNVDVLVEEKGECIICFEDMHGGDTIARLPCLCIYHKRCIDQWFSVRRACPAHPPDED